jgi:uncharacterized protein YciI
MSDVPQQPSYFLIMQRAIGDPRGVMPLMDRHIAWLQEQLDAERLVLTGTGQTETAPGPDAGFIIARADDFAAAKAFAESDPFISEGARSYELFRIDPKNGLLKIRFWGSAGVLA